MPNADPNQIYSETRRRIGDTAKWLVTILGATVVVVVGGGLIARIPDLDLPYRLIAAACLLALTVLCAIPLRSATDIVASGLATLEQMATSGEFAPTRQTVDTWMAGHYPKGIDTVASLHAEYVAQTKISNDENETAGVRDVANGVLVELQPRIREVTELCSTEHLSRKLKSLIWRMTALLPFVGFVLFIFLISTHKDDGTEKLLAKPVTLHPAWSADIESALAKAGMKQDCYMGGGPMFVQISEMSGLRAGLLAVPRVDQFDCQPVRVILTNDGKLRVAD
jgi:hypothetical protein